MMMPKLLINQGDQGAVPGVLFGGVRVLGLFAGDVGGGGFQVGAGAKGGGGVGNRPDLDRQTPHQHQSPITNRISIKCSS